MADEGAPGRGALVAVDWGTSAFRAWLLDRTGTVLAGTSSNDGTLAVAAASDGSTAGRAAAFERILRARCGPWLSGISGVLGVPGVSGIPVIAAGMVGSTHGWHEVPYLELPAGLPEIAAALTPIGLHGSDPSDPSRTVVHLVPGLSRFGPPRSRSQAAGGEAPDVMRGEECQVLGALARWRPTAQAHPGAPTHLVLPGTHTKWVEVREGTITDVVTAMTGELFGVVMAGSIVGRLARDDGEDGEDGEVGDGDTGRLDTGRLDTGRLDTGRLDAAHFDAGVSYALGEGVRRGLAAAIFTARTLVLAGRLPPSGVREYVSGLLIADEVAHLAPGLVTSGAVAVCGAPGLVERYVRVLRRFGVEARALGDDVTVAGLWQVATAAGLVPTQRSIS